MVDFTVSEVQAYCRARLQHPKQNGKEIRAACPVHGGKDPNFAVSLETGQAYCFSRCRRGWDLIGLEMELAHSDFVTAKTELFRIIGRPLAWEDRDVVATYDYRDENGKLLYQVVRKTEKRFMQRRPDGAGGWMWGLNGVAWVPFRLPEILKADTVAITEGEKDAIALSRLGIQATCNNGGAGNFRTELAHWFAGKHVAIFPDNDDPGRKHALKVAEIVSQVSKSLRIIEIPDLPDKGDVSDFISRGGTLEQLRDLYRRAQQWTPEWQFSSNIPDENDRYVLTFTECVKACGGVEKFWDLTTRAGIPTPWEKLTKALRGGMKNGEVYVIGANQGAGKTSLVLQFCMRAMRKRFGVLMFSMEMGQQDVFQRMTAMEAHVDLLEFQDLQENAPTSPVYRDMVSRLQAAQSDLMKYPLYISRKTGITPQYLQEESARLSKKARIDLIVVDHMQLMSTTGKVRGDYEKFTAISRATKETAMEMNVPVILVSQTSRANETDKRTELEVSDLRGSGAIEEDAAGVILLYPDKEDRDRCKANGTFSKGPVKTWLKLDKNRYGVGGMYLPLMHMKSTTRFDLPTDIIHEVCA